MTKAQQGPLQGMYSTFDRMLGEQEMGVAAWPPVPIYQEHRSIYLVLVQCDPDTQVNVRVGYQGRQPIVLRPGESITIPIGDLNQVYVHGDGGASVINWLAML